MPLLCPYSLRASASPKVSYYTTRTRPHRLASDKASFRPSYEPGSCILSSFRILVSLNRPPQVVEQEPYIEAVRLLVLLRVIYCTVVRVANLTPQNRDNSAIYTITALYYRLCTWPLKENNFLIIFLPTATQICVVGLYGLY